MTNSNPATLAIQKYLDHAVQYHSEGRLPEAKRIYQQVLQVDPNQIVALHMLGVIAHQEGKHDTAVDLITKALAINPELAEAHNNLGNALRELGRLDEAVASYHKALAIKPDYAMAHNNLGNALKELNRLEDAIASYQMAIHITPDNEKAHSNLGTTLQELGRLDEAMASYHKALAVQPEYAEAHNNLGNVFKGMGELDKALTSYHKALAINPDYVVAHSNLIFCMANSPNCEPGEILKEAKDWNKTHAQPLAAKAVGHANAPNPERRLKIAYLSGDLRQHPVGFFMEPVFKNHDKAAFEVHVYATHHQADFMTAQFKGQVDQWHDAAHLNPEALAEEIRYEGIDILTDLSGHAAHNGYLTLTCRPAPVQIIGVGIFCTSGLDCVDGLLSDRFETPEGTDSHFSEPLIRLPDGYVCYQPPDYATDVGPAPCLNNGHITFGCFNNLAKISPPALALWAEILRQVPESRLLLKNMAFTSERVRSRYKSLFTDYGISKERLLLEPGLPHKFFMAEYGRVDIGFDPFPYTGGLTTVEALWMGVPVVTLSGNTFAARHSTSHLMNAGLYDLVTINTKDYLQKALELSANFEALEELRQSIRPKMAVSSILDGNRYTRNLERVFRQLWHEWCAKAAEKSL